MSSLPDSEDREHVRGPRDALITLIEYGDFASPPCARAYRELEHLARAGGDLVRFAYRHFPLPQRFPHAMEAAEAAEAAGAQGKFWEMHARLFQNPCDLSRPALLDHAAGLDLDLERFEHDLREHRFAPRIHRDFSAGVRDGVCAAPALFIGGLRYTGPLSHQVLRSVIRDIAEDRTVKTAASASPAAG
jgi:protein-disulfide isomerase